MKDFLPKKRFREIFFLLPIFLFTIFLIIFIFDLALKVWVDRNKVLENPISTNLEFKYPILKTEFLPKVSASGAIVMDANSKIVLYSKNPSIRFSPASTTKLMTALVGSTYFKPQDILTVKIATKEGSILGLYQGEQMTFENLIYSMLLPSANDAAFAIAENYSGGVSSFVEAMNKKAQVLKLINTHYGDPAGLLDSEDFTTPFDLARLASFAVQNPLIKNAVATKDKYITDASGNTVYHLENLNKLLGIDGINGVKTGYTQEAGEVLVTSKLEKGNTIIIVVMGSADRFLDTQKLLDLVNNNLTYLSIHP